MTEQTTGASDASKAKPSPAPTGSRREAAKAVRAGQPGRPSPAPAPLGAAATPAAAASSPTPSRGRKVLKAVFFVVLALVWIRFVLFAVVFPIVERRFDSPELAPAEEVESLGELDVWLDAARTTGA